MPKTKKEYSYAEGINNALELALKKDKNILCYGLGVTDPKGVFGTTIGLEQTTGLSKKVYAAAQSETVLISAADYADNTHSRVYIRNSGSSSTDFFTVTIGGGNAVIGRLYGGDFLFIPYEGEEDIDITSSTTNMELEFMVINEG